jgi:hypothetical protein
MPGCPVFDLVHLMAGGMTVMAWAICAAVAGALCFAVAAALQCSSKRRAPRRPPGWRGGGCWCTWFGDPAGYWAWSRCCSVLACTCSHCDPYRWCWSNHSE